MSTRLGIGIRRDSHDENREEPGFVSVCEPEQLQRNWDSWPGSVVRGVSHNAIYNVQCARWFYRIDIVVAQTSSATPANSSANRSSKLSLGWFLTPGRWGSGAACTIINRGIYHRAERHSFTTIFTFLLQVPAIQTSTMASSDAAARSQSAIMRLLKQTDGNMVRFAK